MPGAATQIISAQYHFGIMSCAMPSKIAVKAANLSAASRRSYGVPDYWVDLDIKCRNCGVLFSFTAAQQQDWDERQQKHLCVQPVLCPRCFFEHSQRRRLKSRMDYALRKLDVSPSVPVQLEAAETIIQYFQVEGRGDIQFALHLLREILQSDPSNGCALTLSQVAEALQPDRAL